MYYSKQHVGDRGSVDQDSLGKQGTEVASSGGLDVLAKPLANGDVSVVLFNENSSTATISTTAGAIGKTGASSYTLTNLWTGATSTTTAASDPHRGAPGRHLGLQRGRQPGVDLDLLAPADGPLRR
jgi:Alpha galactosidase C-terminal beta sandwich domain